MVAAISIEHPDCSFSLLARRVVTTTVASHFACSLLCLVCANLVACRCRHPTAVGHFVYKLGLVSGTSLLPVASESALVGAPCLVACHSVRLWLDVGLLVPIGFRRQSCFLAGFDSVAFQR